MSTYTFYDTYKGFLVSWEYPTPFVPGYDGTNGSNYWRTVAGQTSEVYATTALTFSDPNGFNVKGLDIFSSWDAFGAPEAILQVTGTRLDGSAFSHMIQTKVGQTNGCCTWGPNVTATPKLYNVADMTFSIVPGNTNGPILGAGNTFHSVTLNGLDIAPVPLPAAGLLLAVAIAALFGWRMRA